MAIEIFKEEKDATTKVSLVKKWGKIYLAVVDECGNIANNGIIAEVSVEGLTLTEGFDGHTYGIAMIGSYVHTEEE